MVKTYIKPIRGDLSSLTNSALNVELVYAILLGLNTIIENRNEVNTMTTADLMITENSASIVIT